MIIRKAANIAEGWAKDVLNLEQKLHDERMKICLTCPLYTETSWLGKVCDAKKFYNPETGEVTSYPGDGFVQGCGCALDKKTRVQSAHCVIDKW